MVKSKNLCQRKKVSNSYKIQPFVRHACFITQRVKFGGSIKSNENQIFEFRLLFFLPIFHTSYFVLQEPQWNSVPLLQRLKLTAAIYLTSELPVNSACRHLFSVI